jgi:hypothetical protein
MSCKKKAKTPSRPASSGTWECKHGCKSTGEPCPHLEALLPSMRAGSRVYTDRDAVDSRGARIVYTDRIERYSTAVDLEAEDTDLEKAAKRDRIKKVGREAGLDPVWCDVLVARFVDAQTFDQITRSVGLESKHTAYYIYTKALRAIAPHIGKRVAGKLNVVKGDKK